MADVPIFIVVCTGIPHKGTNDSEITSLLSSANNDGTVMSSIKESIQ